MIPWNRARQKLWFGSEIWLMKPLARDATRMRPLSSIDLRERQLVWRAIFPQIIAWGSRPARKKMGINCLAFDLPGFGFATGFRPSLQVHVEYFTCRHAPVPNRRRYRRGDHAFRWLDLACTFSKATIRVGSAIKRPEYRFGSGGDAGGNISSARRQAKGQRQQKQKQRRRKKSRWKGA